MNLKGAITIVTGGSRGIGKAITTALLQNSAKVRFVDIDAEEGRKVEAVFDKEYGEGMAKFVECDVADSKKFEAILSDTVKQDGRLDILCNNAGLGGGADLDNLISINLTSVIRGTLLGVQYMDNTKGGHGGCIVNMASLAGLMYTGMPPDHASYIATKHGVVAFTTNLAAAAVRVGVRLNCICPTLIDTDMLRANFPPPEDLDLDLLRAGVDKVVPQAPELVAKGFIQLINDETKVGEAMRISMANGIDYHPLSDVVPL